MRPVPRPADLPPTPARLSLARADNIGPSLSRELASSALLDLHIERPLIYVSPPRDVYLLTVFCDEGLDFRADGDTHTPQLLISLLRSRPTPFTISGRGQMVMALVTPLGFLKAFGVPLRGMTDQRLELRDMIGVNSAAQLHDRVLRAPPHTKAAALAMWLEDRIGARRHLEASAQRVAEAAMNSGSLQQTQVDALARGVGLQRRQLERDFRYWLGMAPGGYSKLIRFQRAATDIHAGNELADVTYAQGFADQPHLSRVVRRMSSATPRELGRLGHDALHSQLREAFARRVLVVGRGH